MLLYTFVGIVLSRISSIVFKPFLRKILKIQDEEYEDYLSAKNKDNEIEVFLRIKNMYSIFALIFLLLTFKMIIRICLTFTIKNLILIILYFCMLVLFGVSYKKQHNYMKKRIQIHTNQNREE